MKNLLPQEKKYGIALFIYFSRFHNKIIALYEKKNRII